MIGVSRILLLAVLFCFLFSFCSSGLVVWIGKGEANWEGKRTRVNSIVKRKSEHCEEGGKKGLVGQGEGSQGRKALIERLVEKAERLD